MEGGQDTWFGPLAAEQAGKFADALHLVWVLFLLIKDYIIKITME